MRYKKLLTNLPSMAVIVNAFQSPEVQLVVFQSLMRELDDSITTATAPDNGKLSTRASAMILPNGDVAHDIVEGDSIHSLAGDAND